MWGGAPQEYTELEMCYVEALGRGAVANSEFGGCCVDMVMDCALCIVVAAVVVACAWCVAAT